VLEGFQVVTKKRLEFRLLSTTNVAGHHLLTLNLKNVGSSILKNLVVKLRSPDPRFSANYGGCFVYALMPDADETVKFRVFDSSLTRVYFSVDGYSSGDAYFSIDSPVMKIQTKGPITKEMLM
jgi:hypothetical protein